MALSKDQTELYRRTLEMTRRQIAELDAQIEEELSRAKERLAGLQSARDAARQIYDGACKMLGIENDLENDADAEPEIVPEE